MKRLWKKISTRVPDQYKDEFARQIIKDNFSRLSIFSIILFIIECIIYFVIGCLYNSQYAVMPFIIFKIVVIPIILVVNRKVNTVNIYIAKTVQYIYASAVLVFGIFLTLLSQGEVDFVHMYLMTVLGVTLIINMMPLESLPLLVSAYLAFSFLLPYFQESSGMITVIRQNTLIFNLFAWLQSRMVLKIRLSLFLDRKVIEENNLKLKELAKRDSMTGLLNHVTCFNILREEIEKAQNIGHDLALIIADIDNFKKINDKYGHLSGDHVIIKISQTIMNSVIPTNTVGRYGGEEFIIIMPETDLEKAETIAKKIQRAIKDLEFDGGFKVALSGGISQYTGGSIDEFIRVTDQKLYKAKNLGKDRFEV